MGRKLEHTPRSQIKAALHRLWLRSRERASALKREKYCCQKCGKKQSKKKGKEQKVEVHHANAIAWIDIVEYIRRHLLCHPTYLKVLCPECHKEEHEIEN